MRFASNLITNHFKEFLSIIIFNTYSFITFKLFLFFSYYIYFNWMIDNKKNTKMNIKCEQITIKFRQMNTDNDKANSMVW